MNQLEYIPGIGGQSVQMDGPTSFVGIAENLRSREWEYDLGFRDLVSATRPAREVDVAFYADYATADELRRVADADVTARTPGVFVAQSEWRQRGYVLASKPSDIHFGRLSTELKVALLDGAWWRLVDKSFVVEDTSPTYKSATGKSVTTDGAANVPLHALTVDGESVQDGTPTPSNPVEIQVVQAPDGGTFGISVNGTVTPIDLQGNVLASLPNGTRDTVTIDGAGHVVFEKRVAFANPQEATSIGSSSGNQYVATAAPYTGTPTTSNANNIMGNRGVAAKNAASVGNMYVTAARNTIVLVFANNTFASVAEASAWLQANDTYFYYELATPQTIDLGYIDMPSVFDGAVVSITAEVTPTITAEWQTSPDLYLDYPYDYQYDYQKTSYAESITPSVLTPSDVRLVIYGPAVNPYVIVGGNRYQVNVTVPSGGYVIVDGRDKTIMLTLADGTVQNVFSSGVRGGGAGGGTYIFEKIPAGTSEVTYDGSFGFDLGWYEEEGEPPWNQS